MSVKVRSRGEDAVQRVVEAISAEIASGTLPAGARLVEAGLSARLGVSRGPVREALRHLAAQGMVAHHRHRGAEVRRLTRAEVASLYELREVTEGLAARLAAARLRETASRRLLEDVFGQLAAAALGADPARFGAANAAFHALIVTMAGNPYVAEVQDRFRLGALRTQFRILHDAGVIAESQAAHQRIASAMMAGDGDAAEREMRAHVRDALGHLLGLPDEAFG